MDIGSGVAVAGLGISAASVIIVAITRAYPRKEIQVVNSGKGGTEFIKLLCDERHKNIDKNLDSLCVWMKEIDSKLDDLLRQAGGSKK